MKRITWIYGPEGSERQLQRLAQNISGARGTSDYKCLGAEYLTSVAGGMFVRRISEAMNSKGHENTHFYITMPFPPPDVLKSQCCIIHLEQP